MCNLTSSPLKAPAATPGQSEPPLAWRERLYSRFQGQPAPLLVFSEHAIPAASLWTGARLWIAAFRQAGLRPGDRIAVALPPSAAFLQVLLAGLWEGLTLALLAPDDDAAGFLEDLDARCGVSLTEGSSQWRPEGCSGPMAADISLRPSSGPRTPDVRLLLRTSGTIAAPRWIALSDRNILAVLDSHSPHLALEDACVLSALPWHHAFGLLIDLLPALMAGATIVRDPNGGRSASGLTALIAQWNITHFCMVPLIAQRLWSEEAGKTALRSLRGGVVGGAPVNAPLADALRQTCLRAGYGQTEASPGIALGEPGIWQANYLGRNLGCEIQIGPDQSLSFRGPNACLGSWQSGTLHVEEPGRWVNTGDAVQHAGDIQTGGERQADLFFAGRIDDAFKLDNGRRVEAGRWEAVIKERLSGTEDALLYSPDGHSLALWLTPLPPCMTPDLAEVRRWLGPLGKELNQVGTLPHDDWVRTAKGNTDRRATLQRVAQTAAAL